MPYGPNMRRRGGIEVNRPTNGAAGSAVTVTGTAWPQGSAVQVVWGTDEREPPASGWLNATTAAGTGNWSLATTRPSPLGVYFLHARLRDRPTVIVSSARVNVT